MIQNTSLVVSLTVSQWTARKMDKKITDEVHSNHNTDSDAGRYNKLLVSKQHLDPIVKAVSKARTFHYDNTLVWGDNERLLPAANYFEYVSAMNALKGEFEQAVQAFLSNYDFVIDEAKVRLNGMFNQKDYPTRYEIESKFRFGTVFMPVPSDDFRVHLNDAEVAQLREAVGIEINNRLNDAVKGVWERIAEQLKRMKERLNDTEAVFRDSLFDNLTELLGLLPKLNITNDPNINAVCTEMQALVADPNMIRKDAVLRRDKADEVNKILNNFGAFFS